MIVICLLFLLCLLLAGSVSDDQPNDDQPDQPEPPYLVVFNNAVKPCVLSCFFSKLLGRRWETGVQWRCDRSSYDAMTWWLAALFVLVVLMAWEARQGVAGCSADPSLSIRDKHWRTEVNDGPSQTQVANPSQPRPMRNWRVKKLFPPACDTGTSHHVILWVGLATRQPFPFFTSSEKDLSQTAHAESESPALARDTVLPMVLPTHQERPAEHQSANSAAKTKRTGLLTATERPCSNNFCWTNACFQTCGKNECKILHFPRVGNILKEKS